MYHVTEDFEVEECRGNCLLSKHLHFNTKEAATKAAIELKEANEAEEKVEYESRAMDAQVTLYNRVINHNSGLTAHYKKKRLAREQKLVKILGPGVPVDSFVVNDGRGRLQIHEVLDTAVVIVYDFKTHRRITLFAPPAYRIRALYNNAGLRPPKNLMAQASKNHSKGLNAL